MTVETVRRHPGGTTLDAATLQLYGLVVGHDVFGAQDVARSTGMALELAAAGLERLLAAGLVEELAGEPGRYRPRPPEWAESHLLSPVASDLYERQLRVEETRRTLQLLATSYHQARDGGADGHGIEQLAPGAATRQAVLRLLDSCVERYLVVHAGLGRAQPADDLGANELHAVRRGVKVRSLLPASAALKLTTRAYLRQVAPAGVQVRCTEQVWVQLVLIDDAAVVSTETPDGPGCRLLVRNPAVLERIAEIADHVWATATPLASPEAPDAPPASAVSAATIVRMLASGCTDEVSSRRLNMSLRTYRRHVAALMQQLGARTRFQAGLLAQEQGLLSA